MSHFQKFGDSPFSTQQERKRRQIYLMILQLKLEALDSTMAGQDKLQCLTPCCSDTEAELRRLLELISSDILKYTSGNLVTEIPGLGLLLDSPLVRIKHSDLLELFEPWFWRLFRDQDIVVCPGVKKRIKQLAVKLLDERIARMEGGDPAMPVSIKPLFSDRDTMACPGVTKQIKQLAVKLLDERIGGVEGGDPAMPISIKHCPLKRIYDPLWDMLLMLRSTALNPCAAEDAVHEWKAHVLRARKSLLLQVDLRAEEFPYRKKSKSKRHRTSSFTADRHLKKPHTGLNEILGSKETHNQPKCRPRRNFVTPKPERNCWIRKRIPIGKHFQANVPEWTGAPSTRDGADINDDLDESRWLGTFVLPIDGDNSKTSQTMVGKGRPDSCGCNFPGSINCIKFHVRISRLQLKSVLGVAFHCWGFDSMGEEVSSTWTKEEEIAFKYIMKTNPASQDKSFWRPSLECFHYKKSRDIAKYYFNVYVLRRISKQTRLTLRTVDSDEEEGDDYDESGTNARAAKLFRHHIPAVT